MAWSRRDVNNLRALSTSLLNEMEGKRYPAVEVV